VPLNPPSYSGQDVWYSPSVYVNQVPVALWQPAVPQPSALHSLPVIPSPKYELTQEQIAFATSEQNTTYYTIDADGNHTYVPAGTPGAIAEGTAPGPDALPGQMNGAQTTAIDAAAAGQGGYEAFIGNMNRVLSESRGGAWRGGPSNKNIQQMLETTGIGAGSVFPSGHSFWCAAFMGWMLKISGLKYIVGGQSGNCSASAPSYINYGQSIDIRDPSKWRQGDVAVVSSQGNTSSGSHVTFIWSYPGGGWYKCLGGNQGATPGDVNLAGFQINSFRYIGRAWTDPGRPLPSSPSA
jgi:hypothetical protein